MNAVDPFVIEALPVMPTTAPLSRFAVLFGHDAAVFEWARREFDLWPTMHARHMNMVAGIVDRWNRNKLVGAAMFHNWSGPNIEFGYLGPWTVTPTIARMMATIAAKHFNVLRVTAKTQNPIVIKGLKKFGFEDEGSEADFYGVGRPATRLVGFRPVLIRLAGKGM